MQKTTPNPINILYVSNTNSLLTNTGWLSAITRKIKDIKRYIFLALMDLPFVVWSFFNALLVKLFSKPFLFVIIKKASSIRGAKINKNTFGYMKYKDILFPIL